MSNTDVGAGQQTPYDSSTEFDVISFIVRQRIALLDTMKLVQIVAVHPGTGTPPIAGTVDVQLLVQQIDGSGNVQSNGVVYGIPFFRLQGGKWAVICDPDVGDFGYVVCSDRDVSNVVKNPGQATPGSYRKYSVSDGVYVGGCINQVPVATIDLRRDGTLKITDANGIVLDTTSGSLVITGNVEVNGTLKIDKLETGEDGLNVSGAISATGEITAKSGGASSVTVTGHQHNQGVDSHGDAEQATDSPTPGT